MVQVQSFHPAVEKVKEKLASGGAVRNSCPQVTMAKSFKSNKVSQLGCIVGNVAAAGFTRKKDTWISSLLLSLTVL